MQPRHRLLAAGVVIALIATACNLTAAPVANQSSAEATLAALAVQASVDASVRLTADAGSAGTTAEDAAPEDAAPTDAPASADGATATATLAPAETAQPTSGTTTVTVSVDTNCRKGPNPAHDYLGALLVGESAEVVGRLSNSQWVVVKNPDGGPDCWLWLQYGTVNGDLAALPVMTPPPTPTPTFTPTPVGLFAGTWSAKHFDQPYQVTISQNGNAISMIVNFAGTPSTVSGTVSGANMNFASGTLYQEGVGYTGTFEIQLLPNNNQWIGTVYFDSVGPRQFCGWRNGAPAPNPCMWP